MTPLPFDDLTFRWINQGGLGERIDTILLALADAHRMVPWLIVGAILLATLGGAKWRRTLLLAGLVVAISDPTNRFVVKRLFARERPCQVLDDVVLRAGRCPVSASFPSSHAVNTSAAVTVVSLAHPALALPLAAVAVVTALTRVYQGVHFPLDVIGGLVLGAAFGLVGFELARGAPRRRLNRLAHAIRGAAVRGWRALGERRWLAAGAVLLAANTAFNVIAITRGGLDLAPDEAHYWEWSRRLDLSYYSKGPGIAYLIRATTALFGSSPAGIRMSAVLASTVLALAMFVLARRITGSDRAAVLGLVTLRLSPLFTAGGMLATIDPPFAACWALALVALERAFRTGSTRAWLAAGLATGVAFLFKYTAGVLAPCVIGALLVVPALRAQLRRPGPYLCGAVAAALTLPVWIWNARHGWVTTAHVGKLAGVGKGAGFDVGQLLEFVGSQIGVLTPWVAVLLGLGMARSGRAAWQTRDPGHVLLFATSAPILAFFTLKSGQAKVQANWAVPAYLAAGVSAGWVLDQAIPALRGRRRQAMRRLAAACVAASLMVSALMGSAGLAQDFFEGLPGRLDPTARLRGWRGFGLHVGRVLEAWRAEGAAPLVFVNQYAKASELAFYVPGHPRVYSVRLDRRYEQYDLWNDLATVPAGAAALYVGGSGGIHPGVAFAFEDCRELPAYRDPSDNQWLGTQRLFRCEGFRGFPEWFPQERF
ncbi:MAG: glycosyltransferase family 39 protein [bacterium]